MTHNTAARTNTLSMMRPTSKLNHACSSTSGGVARAIRGRPARILWRERSRAATKRHEGGPA
eukprot:8193123-Alexandrium_andersonii.AAC.1